MAIRCSLISLLYFLVGSIAKGQPAVVDSTNALIQSVRKMQPGIQKIESLIGLGNSIYRRDGAKKEQLDSALRFFAEGGQIARQIGAPEWEAQCLRAKAKQLAAVAGDTTGAAASFEQALASYRSRGDVDGEAQCLEEYGTMLLDHTDALPLALSCFEQGRALYQKRNNLLSAHRALKSIASTHAAQGKLVQAADELTEALRFFSTGGMLAEKLGCEVELANVYWKRGNTQQALYYNNEALKSARLLQDDYWLASVTNALSRQYFDLKMYSEALPLMEQSLAYAKRTNAQSDYVITLLNVVFDRVKLKKTEGLLAYVKRADGAMPTAKAVDRVNLFCAYGLTYHATGDTKTAEHYFLEMMRTFDQLSKANAYGNYDQLFSQTYNRTIGEFYIETKQFEKARPHFQTVLSLPKTAKTPLTESEVHLALYTIDSAAGNYLSAIRHLQTYTQLHDSIFNANAEKQIADVKARYQADQRSKDLVVLQSKQQFQSAQVQKARWQRNITFAGSLALVVLAVFLYWGYRNKQRVYRQLDDQKAMIDEQNLSLKSLLAEKEVLLNEKDWLLKEVHHRVKNNLQVITSLLNFQSAATKKADALEAIKISRNRVQAISLVHAKLSGGHNLATVHIQSYVSELIEHLCEGFVLPAQCIEFEKEIDDLQIDLAQAVPIGLILNEAITNSIKHAFGKGEGKIKVTLKETDAQMIFLQVTDNGQGFAPGIDPAVTKSLGFKIMRGLSAQLKGALTIEGTKGTTITVWFARKDRKGAESPVRNETVATL